MLAVVVHVGCGCTFICTYCNAYVLLCVAQGAYLQMLLVFCTYICLDKVAKLEGELKAYEQQQQQQQQQQEVQLPAPVEESDGGFISKLVYTEELVSQCTHSAYTHVHMVVCTYIRMK